MSAETSTDVLARGLQLLDEICQDALEVPLSHTDSLGAELPEYEISAKFHELKGLLTTLHERLEAAERERDDWKERQGAWRWAMGEEKATLLERAETAEARVRELEGAVREYEKRLGIPEFASLATTTKETSRLPRRFRPGRDPWPTLPEEC